VSKKKIEQLSDNQIKQWIKSKPPIETKLCDGNYLYLRMCQKNTPYFIFRVRLKTNTGIKNTWQSIGEYPTTTLAMARDKARGMRTLVARGINPIDYSSDVAKLGLKFGEVCGLYTMQYFPTIRDSSKDNWVTVMSRTAVLNNIVMEKITEADIKEILKKADGSPSVAAGILQRLKSVFNWAVDEGYIPNNPITNLRRSFKVTPRERYLQPYEIKTFFNTLANDHIPLVTIKVAIYSLAILLTRREELLSLKWQDVDLTTGRIVIRQTKTIKDFTIIIPAQLIKLWTKLRNLHPDSQYVFGCRKTHYSGMHVCKHIVEAAERYSMQKFTPHDFRRTGMTLLAEQGHRHDVIDAALGHSISGVKKHYLKSNLLEERKKLLQDWADYIDSLLEIENKPVGTNWLWIDLARL